MAEPTVADIMDREPATVSPSTDVSSLIRLLREHELPGVPVVQEDGTLVRIVTESDLVLRGDDSSLHLPHYLEIFGGIVFLEPLQHLEDKLRKAFATKVEEMMTADVDTIRPEASVHEAAQLISRTGHNRIPVVEGTKLIGVVTRVDALDGLTRAGE
jgi:CBS domain-containing protein